MAIALKGSNCVIWYKPVETFPYVGGVGGIVMSWFLSPVFSGLIACGVFYITRATVLRKSFDTKRINWAYPVLIGSTMTINTFFIIYKGAKGLGLHKTPLSTAFIVAFGAGGIVSIITIPIVPKLKKYVYKLNNANNNLEYDADNEMEICYNETEIDDNKLEYNVEMIKMDIIEKNKTLNIKNKLELERIEELHNNVEKFDENLEGVFKYLQIFTAICDSFSHGANDVANAIGPFVTIYTIYTTNGLSKKNEMEEEAYWILALGGVGIATGLYIYGKKITYAIGE